MPEEDDDLGFDEEDDELEEAELVKKLRGLVKAKTKENKTLAQQLEQGSEAQRKLAIMEAKLPDTPQVKFFLENYKGELDAGTIRSKAAEFGFIEPDKEAEQEANQVNNMMQAGVGANAPPGPGSDAAVLDEINAIPPGPDAARRIQQVMIKHGRYVPDDT